MHRLKETKDNISVVLKKDCRTSREAPKEKKGKKMKRLFLVAVAVLSMNAAFAGNDRKSDVYDPDSYVLEVNMYRLGQVLNLDNVQFDAVSEINMEFSSDLKYAGNANRKFRHELVDKALKKNVCLMRRVLDDKQYRTYLMLLNATMNNRGLK